MLQHDLRMGMRFFRLYVVTVFLKRATKYIGGGRVVRWCWVNFQCRGVLLLWINIGQGLTALAVGAGRGCLDLFFSRLSVPYLSPSGRRPDIDKYCIKGPLNTKQSVNQPKPSTYSIQQDIYEVSVWLFQYFMFLHYDL